VRLNQNGAPPAVWRTPSTHTDQIADARSPAREASKPEIREGVGLEATAQAGWEPVWGP
jgi:hypothetical protein